MMKIKHDPIHIPYDGRDPFINCKLGRKPYADALTNVVNTYAEGFVMAVNNEWGAGKTTFINMWQQQLKNEGFETLYFNAWENDFQDDVIIALLSELKELRDEASEKFDSVLKNAATFLRKVAPAVIKGAASKAIGDDAVTEIVGAVTSYTTEEVEEELKAFSEKKKGIQDFRKSLETFVEKVDSDKPVVFFIDELDRCRPDYAVRVLERIKHLFSVPGIVFVLSIDKEQLGHAVCGYYGSDNINASEYLRRFIDLEFSIPEPSVRQFCEYLYEYYEFSNFTNHPERKVTNSSRDGERLIEICSALNENKNLRAIDKMFARVRTTICFFALNQTLYPDVLVFLAYLEQNSYTIYKEIKGGKLTVQDFLNRIEQIIKPIFDVNNQYALLYLIGELLYRYNIGLSNKYREEGIDLLKRPEGQNFSVLTLKSDLENTFDDYNTIAKSIESMKRGFGTQYLGLDKLISFYDLTDSVN